MKKTTLDIEKQVLILLNKKMLQKLHSDYLRWLKFYLDFCSKYKFKEDNHESLPKFLNKLKHPFNFCTTIGTASVNYVICNNRMPISFN